MRIVSAAIKLGDVIVSMPCPARHHDILNYMGVPLAKRVKPSDQGFLTDTGRFLNRKAAYYVARANNQIDWGRRFVRSNKGQTKRSTLYSEDLW